MQNIKQTNIEPTKQQYQATGDFHQRMAAALAEVGRHGDAAFARRAADACRRNAE